MKRALARSFTFGRTRSRDAQDAFPREAGSSVAHESTPYAGRKMGEAGVFLLFFALFTLAFLI